LPHGKQRQRAEHEAASALAAYLESVLPAPRGPRRR
jgi:hypothetical protein